MKKISSLLTTVLIYFCVATVIAQAAAVLAFWARGALDQSRMYRVLAALHGIDIITVQTQLTAKEQASSEEQASYEEQLKSSTLKSLDIDLREMAYDKGLLDVYNLLADLQTKQSEFEEVKLAWESRLQKYAEEQQASSMVELERTLEAINPEQAKEQIVKMIDDGAIDVIVGILKRMAIDKRKKIVAEFQQPNEAEMLHDILEKMRNGEPITSEIKVALNNSKQLGQGN